MSRFQVATLFHHMCKRWNKLNFLAKRCCHHFHFLTRPSLLWTAQVSESQSFRKPYITDTRQVAWMALTMPFSGWVHWTHRYIVCIQWFRFQCRWGQLGWWLDRSRRVWELALCWILRCSWIDLHECIASDQELYGPKRTDSDFFWCLCKVDRWARGDVLLDEALIGISCWFSAKSLASALLGN